MVDDGAAAVAPSVVEAEFVFSVVLLLLLLVLLFRARLVRYDLRSRLGGSIINGFHFICLDPLPLRLFCSCSLSSVGFVLLLVLLL